MFVYKFYFFVVHDVFSYLFDSSLLIMNSCDLEGNEKETGKYCHKKKIEKNMKILTTSEGEIGATNIRFRWEFLFRLFGGFLVFLVSEANCLHLTESFCPRPKCKWLNYAFYQTGRNSSLSRNIFRHFKTSQQNMRQFKNLSEISFTISLNLLKHLS